MKSCFAGLLLVCCLINILQAQDSPRNETTLKMLEEHLLAWPDFQRPFYDLLGEGLDETGWQHLEERWERLRKSDKRYDMLRGMLAERQGEFQKALAHFASVKNDGGGAYHHARLLAFTGEMEQARKELDEIARKTDQVWIFREAVRGIGELLLLKDGVAAAERNHAALWEKRTELPMQMALMEPLLTLRMEQGRGQSWLDSIRPSFGADVATPSLSKIDQAVLWFWGAALAQASAPSMQPGMGPPMFLRTDDALLYGEPVTPPAAPWFQAISKTADVGRWHGTLIRETGIPFIAGKAQDLAASLLRHHQMDDSMLEAALVFAAIEGSSQFMQVAELARQRLRVKPWLAARAIQFKGDVLSGAREELSRGVFADVRQPSWLFWSLLLRCQSGEKPEQLHDDALALWRSTNPDERLVLREGMVSGWRAASPLLAALSESYVQSGYAEPSLAVVWNLRGADFTRAMRARFEFELQKVFTTGITATAVPAPTAEPPAGRLNPQMYANIENGALLRSALWRMRDRLGLKAAELSGPDAQMPEPVRRAMDVLLRGSMEEICAFLTAEPQLVSMPAKWLLSFKNTIASRRREKALDEQARKACTEAEKKLDAALLAQRPHWTVPSLLANKPIINAPVLDDTQRRELLVTHFKSSRRDNEDVKTTWLQNWRKLVPGAEDEKSLEIERLTAFKSLETQALPHALWGLQWQPSLRRQRALLNRRNDGPAPPVPSFLTQTLPEMAKTRPDEFLETVSSLAPSDLVSLKLVQCFGFGMLRPQLGREAELRQHAARHPFVSDLLAVWQHFGRQSAGIMPRPVFKPYQMTPRQMLGAVEVLKKSQSSSGRLTFAVLQQRYGDPALARQLTTEFKDKNDWMRLLAREMEQNPAAPQATPTAPPVVDVQKAQGNIITRAEKVFAEASATDMVDNLVHQAAPNTEDRRIVYEWLRGASKPEPAFARHAGALAYLARLLKVPDKELSAAEQLDLQLNKDNPETWLRRGISYAREKNNDWAVDLFLEAVRRTDFAKPPNFFWVLAPPEVSWLERTVKSGRTDELASALGTALTATKTDTARDVAASMMQAVMESPDTPMRPARLQRLMEIVLKHQRHLILPRFDSLRETLVVLDKAGKTEMATLLARMVLLGVWPEGKIDHNSYSPGSSTNNLPTGVWNAKSAWGGSTDEVGPNAVIMPLFQTALRGEDVAEFADRLLGDARMRPDDEHLVSCALMARALRGPLSLADLKLADKLGDQAQMRVAWRLCEHAPVQSINLIELSPFLARGLKSIFLDKGYLGNGSRHYLLAEKVVPWLEKAGADEAVHGLLPLFMQALNEDLFQSHWRQMVTLTCKYQDAAFLSLIAEKWSGQCQRQFKLGYASQDWLLSTITALAVTTQELESGQGSAFGRLADDVWHAFVKKYGAHADPPVAAAHRLCDALLASGETKRLLALAADVQRIIHLGGEPGYEVALQRIHRSAEFLDAGGTRIPSAQMWVNDVAADETTGQVHWRQSADLDGGIADDAGSMRVPHGAAPRGVVMQCLARQLDLEIFAGVSPDSLSLRQTIHGVAATGVIELKNLPAAGWVCGVLRRPGTGVTNFGTPVIYCLRRPLLDTAVASAATPPVWRDAWQQQHGRPVSPVISVADGMQLFISDASGISDREAESHVDSLSLVALDEKQEPVGRWPLGSGMGAGQMLLADGNRVLLLQPTAWMATDGWMRLRAGGRREAGVVPQHLVLTTSAQQEHPRLPQVQVRLFSQTP